jgi:hypothetical protein
VLAPRGVGQLGDQSDAQRAVRAHLLEQRQLAGIAVDRVLPFGAVAAQVAGIDEDGGDAGVDQRGRQRCVRQHQVVGHAAGREQGAGRARSVARRARMSQSTDLQLPVVTLPGATMTAVKAIEAAVKALAPQDLAEFRAWFAEYDLAAWDAQIESDVRSGKLDRLLAEAEQDHKAGDSRKL